MEQQMESRPALLPSESSLATLWLILIRLVKLYGVDADQFVKEIGINPASIRDANARIPYRFSDVAFSRAKHHIPDPAFGLLAAKCWHPSNLGVMGYAWLSSENLRAGLKRLDRFSRILGPRVNFRCQGDKDTLRFIYGLGHSNSPLEEVKADVALSLVLDMCRMNTGTRLNPLNVNLMRAIPENQKPYQDFFGCPIHFGATENSFLLDATVADAPLPSTNHELSATFDTILSGQLASLAKMDLPSLCKTYILKQLTSGEPTEEGLASSLAMSRRTLQRKLEEHGVNYKQLVDETRYKLAQHYLDDKKLSMTEITFLLGFSEPSAFTRAFRRWHGSAPSLYRQAAL
jgi:AraC-like DNA-binding protein